MNKNKSKKYPKKIKLPKNNSYKNYCEHDYSIIGTISFTCSKCGHINMYI